jgi:isoleucyl-tRNA synthetase
VNAKTCEVVASDDALVSLKGRANFRALGRRYGKDTPRAAAAAAELPADALRALERGETVTAGAFTFGPEDVTVAREVASDWEVQSDGPYVVALDPTLTEELTREGLAREVVNRVQRLRKEAGYEYTTRIELALSGDAEVVEAARRHLSFIEGETLTRRTLLGGVLDGADVTQDVDIEGRRLTIAVRRHDGRKGETR